MKRILLFGLLALSVGFLFAQNVKPDEAAITEEIEKTTDGPMMTLESMEVSYGEIEQNSDPLRTVAFTNTGTEPLVISSARGSCGCTVPTYPKEPIMPGESSLIEIRYDTKRMGSINKTVKISTNDKVGTHVIRVTGKIHAKASEESLPKKEGVLNNNK
jgi:hypothetical protein